MTFTTFTAKLTTPLAKKCAKILAGLICVGFFALVAVDSWISSSTRPQIYDNIEQLPHRNYGVVLGTAKYYMDNTPNLYYKYRLEAASRLFKQHKVDKLLLSGEGSTPYYNEPRTMRKDLSKMDIPERFLEQDMAGLRTRDSVLRATHVFNLGAYTLITQRFHCERALFIAKYHNIDAICYAAQYPEGHIQVRIREMFARVGMLVDLWLGHDQTFLNELQPLSMPLNSGGK